MVWYKVHCDFGKGTTLLWEGKGPWLISHGVTLRVRVYEGRQ